MNNLLRLIRRWFVVLQATYLVLALLILPISVGLCQEDAGHQELVRQWKSQQDSTESARIVLSGKQAFSMDYSGPFPERSAGRSESSSAATLRSEAFRVEIAFLGIEGWCKIESDRPMFHLKNKQYSACHRITAYDGTEDGARSLLKKGSGGNLLDVGKIDLFDRRNADLGLLSLNPIFFTFRGLSPAFFGTDTIDMLSVEVDSDKGFTVSNEYIEYRFDGHPMQSLKRLQVNHGGGQPFAVLTVSDTQYSDDKSFLYPARWGCVYYDTEGLVSSWEEYTVLECQLNIPLRRDHFRLEFEDNSVVSTVTGLDEEVLEHWGPNKEKRPVSYEQLGRLVHQGPEFLGNDLRRGSTRRLIFYFNGCFLVVLCGLIVWRYVFRWFHSKGKKQ